MFCDSDLCSIYLFSIFFFKQKTAYEMRISDWSSDVCSSDLIGNAAVVVPVYGQPNDQAALEALKPFFPGRDIVGLMSDAILTGGGSFHCISQQMPSA